MRLSLAIKVIGAVLLLAGALIARNVGRTARAEAAAWQQLATLRYDEVAATELPGLPLAVGALTGAVDADRLQATIDYWLGRYEGLVQQRGGATDPDVLWLAANAAFRVARRDGEVGPDAARQLEPVLRAYSNVLKLAPLYRDAAYNLEYVSKLQNHLAGMRPFPKTPDLPAASGPVQTTDLPRGHTVHGWPGGPPPRTKTEDFEILTPRGSDASESDPGQAPGARVRRKG